MLWLRIMLKGSKHTNQEEKRVESTLSNEEEQARRLAARENAKRVMQQSGLADMLRAINKDKLKGRGTFEEYDTILLFKWGSGYTRRHIWIEIDGDNIRFRLRPHRQCAPVAPLCDEEYHTFTPRMWANRQFLQSELDKYYTKPVAESSDD